jgi:hypothetical protein
MSGVIPHLSRPWCQHYRHSRRKGSIRPALFLDSFILIRHCLSQPPGLGARTFASMMVITAAAASISITLYSYFGGEEVKRNSPPPKCKYTQGRVLTHQAKQAFSACQTSTLVSEGLPEGKKTAENPLTSREIGLWPRTKSNRRKRRPKKG